MRECKAVAHKRTNHLLFHRFRKLNTRRLDHKRRLIDSFVNAIYLYDDKMVITFNYKEGSETVSLSEIEKSDLGSDLTSSASPQALTLVGAYFYIINAGYPHTYSLS